jgi:hypothetical protein
LRCAAAIFLRASAERVRFTLRAPAIGGLPLRLASAMGGLPLRLASAMGGLPLRLASDEPVITSRTC